MKLTIQSAFSKQRDLQGRLTHARVSPLTLFSSDQVVFSTQLQNTPIQSNKSATVAYDGDIILPKHFKTENIIHASGSITLQEGSSVGGLKAGGHIHATGATIHGAMVANKNVTLSNCQVTGDITSYGNFKASALTHQGNIFTPSGKLRIMGSTISGILAAKGPVTSVDSTITGDILANETIRLNKTTLSGQAISSQGSIFAKHSSIGLNLFAKQKLTARDCAVQQSAIAQLAIDWRNGQVGQTLESKHGPIKLSHAKVHKLSAGQSVNLNEATIYTSVTAQNGIDITKSHIYESTHSKTGKIKATHSTLGDLHSQQDILLDHVTLNGKIKTDSGTIHISHAAGNNYEIESISTLTLIGCRGIKKIKAYGNLNIINSEITAETSAVGSYSTIRINDSTLKGHFSYPTSAAIKITTSTIPPKSASAQVSLESTCVS